MFSHNAKSTLWIGLAVAGYLTLARPARAADDVSPDFEHTIAARQALLTDARVGALNLGVKIRDRVVVLWGTAPSAELSRRATELLRAMPEFVAVHSEVQIDENVLPSRPAYLPEPSAGAARRLFEPKGQSEWLPTIGILTLSPPPPPTSMLPSVPFAPAAPPAVAVLPPVSPAFVTTLTVKATPPADTAVKPAVALEQQLADLQRADPHFRDVQLEAAGGVVTVRGSMGQSVTHEAARIVARVPGVTQVILRPK